MANPKVSKALEEARKLVADLESYEDNPINHQAIIKQTERVRNAFQEPIDLVTRLFEDLSLGGAFHTILGIRAYHAMPEDGSSITADELARITNVAPTVIHRTYRVAVNHGLFKETAPDTYAHNELSRVLNPMALGSFFMITLEFTRAWIHLPEYLKSHKPDDVFDLTKSPAVYSVGKEHLGKSYYELLEIDPDPERRAVWNANMFMVDQLMPVTGMFPFASLKEEVEKDPERPYLVDIGAGRGQSCFAVKKQIDGAFDAKFILQDLPGVIDNLKPEEYPGIELMTYDAFTPQPVKSTYPVFASMRWSCLWRRPSADHSLQMPTSISCAASSMTFTPQSASSSSRTQPRPWGPTRVSSSATSWSQTRSGTTRTWTCTGWTLPLCA